MALQILWIFSCNLKKYIYMPFKFHYDTSKCYSLSRDCFSTVFKTHIRSLYIVFDGHCLELLHFSKSMSLSICKPYLSSTFVHVQLYYIHFFFMFPFCVCFKLDAYVNLKLFEYKEKRIMRRSKGCTCISLVRHSDYSLPGTLIRQCSCCGYFVRSKKK